MLLIVCSWWRRNMHMNVADWVKMAVAIAASFYCSTRRDHQNVKGICLWALTFSWHLATRDFSPFYIIIPYCLKFGFQSLTEQLVYHNQQRWHLTQDYFPFFTALKVDRGKVSLVYSVLKGGWMQIFVYIHLVAPSNDNSERSCRSSVHICLSV